VDALVQTLGVCPGHGVVGGGVIELALTKLRRELGRQGQALPLADNRSIDRSSAR